MVLIKIPRIQLISHASKFAKVGNKKYCHPLTIAETRSRFVFAAKPHYKEDYKFAKTEFTKIFRAYGLPKQIHTDNGRPFGSVAAIQRFTRLSYWFIDTGDYAGLFRPGTPRTKRET